MPPPNAPPPASGAHSIWEIIEHVTFWLDAVRRRLAGEVLDLHDGDDWPVEENPSPQRWQSVVSALDAGQERLLAAIRALADADLEHIVPAMGYTNYVMIHGAVQHTLYHAGQIALLLRTSQAHR